MQTTIDITVSTCRNILREYHYSLLHDIKQTLQIQNEKGQLRQYLDSQFESDFQCAAELDAIYKFFRTVAKKMLKINRPLLQPKEQNQIVKSLWDDLDLQKKSVWKNLSKSKNYLEAQKIAQTFQPLQKPPMFAKNWGSDDES